MYTYDMLKDVSNPKRLRFRTSQPAGPCTRISVGESDAASAARGETVMAIMFGKQIMD